jgi:PhnB protein
VAAISVVRLAPWISVPDVARAMEFYRAAFGAEERYRLAEGDHLFVAQVAIGEADFWLQEDDRAVPPDGGGPIRFILSVEDPDAWFSRAMVAGGKQVTAVHDEHGWRTGRLVDPFGFHWEVARRLGGG